MAHTTDQLNAALAGRYTIDRKLGEGGMATVYLARDARHSRRVAVKVLKPDLAAVVGVDRFLSEITVTANLQHPNLLPLFDSGEADGLLFYVMPYVEGETLRGRLEREKQLPVDDAVAIGVAVASALDYAHRHGVIHRDLKPENILLHEGQPVVADFGIALAVSNAGAGRITQTGLSLGTPQYMSPEQATGDRQIDARTDIYALGAVLYEMLTGDPPHTASTAQAVIARVLTERPRAIRITRPSVPEHVAAAVEHALEKLPADRFSTAQDMGDALLGRSRVELPHSSAAVPKGRRTPALRAAPWAATIVFAAVAVWAMFKPAPPQKVGVVDIPLPAGTASGTIGRAVAISPDGSRIIVVAPHGGIAQLYQRMLDEVTLHPIAGAEAVISPSFSPDGQWLLGTRRSDRRLYKIPVTGGGLIPVADSATNGSWGDHGSIFFGRGGDLWRVPAGGGAETRITSIANAKLPVRALALPEVLPGERYAVVTAIRVDGQKELARVTLSNGKLDLLGVIGTNPRYSAGYLLFADVNSTLLAARFSARSATFQSAPVPVRAGVMTFANGTSQFAVSAEGTLIGLFSAASASPAGVEAPVGARQLVEVDANGSSRPLFKEPRFYGWAHISPDGNRVALEIADAPGGPWDVWVLDIRSATLTRLTTNGTGIRPAGWTDDGRKIVFLQRPPGTPTAGGVAGAAKIVAMPWDRSGPPDTLFSHEISEGASIGPPHSYLAVAVGPSPGANDLWIAPLDTLRAARPFVASPANETTPAVSPNGKLLAYTSDESGRVEVYVAPLAGPRGRILVSTGGGTEPVWDRASGGLYYRGPQRLMRATIAAAPELRVVKRDSLFEDKYWHGTYSYDVFPDGKHFLMIQGDDASAQATLILNWPTLLNRRGADRR